MARCAVLAGLSKSTMSQAVAHLRDLELIVPVPGVGLRIANPATRARDSGKPDAETPLFDASLPAHQRIKSLVLHDIVRGTFPPGKPLPSYKVLRNRYGTGPLTLKRAIEVLTREVRLTPHGRGYAVPTSRYNSRPAIVLLFPRASLVYRSRLYRWSQKLEMMARRLERRGYEANFTLFPHQYLGPIPSRGFTQHTVADLRLEELTRNQSVIGYVYWDTSEYFHQAELVDWLKRSGKPVAIVDDSGGFRRELLDRSSPLMQLITLGASRVAPRRIAQHLLRLGHTKAAFLTLYHRLAWSEVRLNEIRSVFGPDREVRLFPEPAPEDRLPSKSQLTANRYALIPEILPLLETLYQNNVPKKVENQLGRLYKSLTTLTEAFSLADLNQALDAIVADRDITALACVNDDIALYSMRYLRSKNVRIPEDLSVVGFDDTPEAAAADLTTYNFDIEAATNTVLDHLLRPPPRRARGAARVVETEGILMERKTTGIARSLERSPRRNPPA